MSIASDWIAVWIEDGIVYAGIKRIYDYEETTGYIVEKYDYFNSERRKELEKEATLLAVKISAAAALPFKQNWR